MRLKPFICIALFILLLACSGKVAKEESPESLFELGLMIRWILIWIKKKG